MRLPSQCRGFEPHAGHEALTAVPWFTWSDPVLILEPDPAWGVWDVTRVGHSAKGLSGCVSSECRQCAHVLTSGLWCDRCFVLVCIRNDVYSIFCFWLTDALFICAYNYLSLKINSLFSVFYGLVFSLFVNEIVLLSLDWMIKSINLWELKLNWRAVF